MIADAPNRSTALPVTVIIISASNQSETTNGGSELPAVAMCLNRPRVERHFIDHLAIFETGCLVREKLSLFLTVGIFQTPVLGIIQAKEGSRGALRQLGVGAWVAGLPVTGGSTY